MKKAHSSLIESHSYEQECPPAPLTSLELFAGAGGAALGVEKAGWGHIACIEWWETACDTLRAAGMPTVESDVRHVDYSVYRGKIGLMWASPPCQAWSEANQSAEIKGEDDIERNGWPWTLKAVSEVQPTWLVAENVKGAKSYIQKVVIPELRKQFPSVQLWQLNAKFYGVPQSRTRLFIVAGPVPISAPQVQPLITMRTAIGVPYDKPSPCVMTNEWKGRPTEPKWWRKLNNASDALAIATNGARLKLTVQECMALQSFPDGYPLQGTDREKHVQVGNAVPPPLAHTIASAVMEAESRRNSVSVPDTEPKPWYLSMQEL